MKNYICKFIVMILFLGGSISCRAGNQPEFKSEYSPDELENLGAEFEEHEKIVLNPISPGEYDKWDLWSSGTQLRGANIHQRLIYPELEGDYLGVGPLGPPYNQDDFDALSALGANYVNISHPGLFNSDYPYEINDEIVENLDDLLEMISNADLFAVISFRTGPGRSEFTFFWDEVGGWFDKSYLNDSIWGERAAQEAWVEMWRKTAQRYRNHPNVVGYDLMVEPNSNEVGNHALDDFIDVWEPEEFYNEFGGSLYDWNQLYPQIVDAIRSADLATPILIGGNAYSRLDWLNYLDILPDDRIVYIVHQYEPFNFTHQEASDLDCEYPGMCDTDWDGNKEQIDREWLETHLQGIRQFQEDNGVPVGVNEYGIVRWVPGGIQFMDVQMEIFEQLGVNYALWEWRSNYEPFSSDMDYFDFRHGTDPKNHADISNELLDVIKKYWSKNSVWPSTAGK